MEQAIKISRILSKTTSQQNNNCYAVFWIQNEVGGIEINKTLYKNVSNAVFFLNPTFNWKILKKDTSTSSGYVLLIPKEVLNHPTFKNLHITEVRLFSANEIPKINLSPGIETRIQSILEMLDELLSTNLKHREEAILALLKTFFVYCDGKCNIKSVITDNNAKSALVYKFKKSINRYINQYHKVGYYAKILNVSDKYLNECVNSVLGVKAKHLTDEQMNIGLNSKLMGQVNICRKALEVLKPNGAIILTGGIFAHNPWPETTNIAMVNAALEGFVKALALELTEGRRVLVVHPPFVKETAQALGMDGSNCPPAMEVARVYVLGLESKETGKAIYVDE